MTARLEKACNILKWAISNKKTIKEASKVFNTTNDFIPNAKKSCKIQEGYKEFLVLYSKFKSKAQVSISEDDDKDIFDKDLPKNKQKFSQSGQEATYEYDGSEMLTSLEDAIKFFKIDTKVWEVERYLCNSYPISARKREQDLKWVNGVMSGHAKRADEWTTTVNYQVKLWLKKSVVMEVAIDFEKFYREELAKHDPFKYKSISYAKHQEKNLLELNIFDLHLGKLCWSEEVENNYDTKIASARFNYALTTLIKRAQSTPFDRIVFPIGNDFFNSDGHLNQTTLGTRQDEDSRWQKTFKTGKKLLIEAIDYLRQFAPVDVLVIPGNHDWTKSFFLGETLSAWYRNDSCVTVNNNSNPRKYYSYGNVLLGFTHGNNEKHEALRSLMAYEAKELWAKTVYKEWHVGHQHRKLSTRSTVKSDLLHEELGVTVRSMSSIAGTDSWHHTMGYVGPTRAAEGFLWNSETGLIGNLNVNIKLNDDL